MLKSCFGDNTCLAISWQCSPTLQHSEEIVKSGLPPCGIQSQTPVNWLRAPVKLPCASLTPLSERSFPFVKLHACVPWAPGQAQEDQLPLLDLQQQALTVWCSTAGGTICHQADVKLYLRGHLLATSACWGEAETGRQPLTVLVAKHRCCWLGEKNTWQHTPSKTKRLACCNNYTMYVLRVHN